MRQLFLCHRKKQILCPAVGTVRMKRLLQLEKGKRRCRPYKSAFLYGWERKNAISSVQKRVSVRLGKKKCGLIRTKARFGAAGEGRIALSQRQRIQGDLRKTAFPGIMKREQRAAKEETEGG